MSNGININDDGIVEIHVVGNQDYASVTSMGVQVKRLLEQLGDQGKPQLVLDDITKLGTSDIAARRAVATFVDTLPFERAAMLGDGSVIMRVATNLLLRAVGKGSKVKYFEDRKKAVEWLLHG